MRQPLTKSEFQGLAIRVVPGAKKEGAEVGSDGTLKIRLRARAVDGKANAALREFLSASLGVSANAIILRAGEHSRNKIIQVEGFPPQAVREKLLGHLI